MFTHPDRLIQLAREHQRQMLADASQRHLRHRHGQQAPSTPNAAARISRRLATVIARAGVVAAETPCASWPAGSHPLGEPVAQAQKPGGR
jgi:hypothetical protein